MAKENVAPTKSNLMSIKEQLSVAKNGYGLLDQKREILLMELMNYAEKIRLLEEKIDKQLEKSYGELKKLFLFAGGDAIERAGNSAHYDFEFIENHSSVAGINFSTLQAKMPQNQIFASVLDSPAQTSKTAAEFFSLLSLLTDLASIRTIAWRLAVEIKKTQRRVNALDKIVIPQKEETKKFIENVLEERDRENIFVLKSLKRKK